MRRFALTALLAALPLAAIAAEAPQPRADHIVAALSQQVGALNAQLAIQQDEIAQLLDAKAALEKQIADAKAVPAKPKQ